MKSTPEKKSIFLCCTSNGMKISPHTFEIESCALRAENFHCLRIKQVGGKEGFQLRLCVLMLLKTILRQRVNRIHSIDC